MKFRIQLAPLSILLCTLLSSTSYAEPAQKNTLFFHIDNQLSQRFLITSMFPDCSIQPQMPVALPPTHALDISMDCKSIPKGGFFFNNLSIQLFVYQDGHLLVRGSQCSIIACELSQQDHRITLLLHS